MEALGAGRDAVRPRASGSASPGWPGTGGTCRFCRRGGGEPVRGPTLHRLGRRRRLRRVRAWSTRRYAYRLPDGLDDEQAAPLLCAGIIGYRALRPRAVPPGRPARDLRLRRLARTWPPRSRWPRALRVHVHDPVGRGPRGWPCGSGRLGVGEAADPPPEPLDGAILFAPAGELVPVALRALDRGGTLAVAGIWVSRHPGARLRAPAVPGAQAAQRHRQHPGRREEFLGLAAPMGSGRRPCPTRSSAPPQALADLAHGRVDRRGRPAWWGEGEETRSSRPPLVTMTLRNDCVQLGGVPAGLSGDVIQLRGRTAAGSCGPPARWTVRPRRPPTPWHRSARAAAPPVDPAPADRRPRSATAARRLAWAFNRAGGLRRRMVGPSDAVDVPEDGPRRPSTPGDWCSGRRCSGSWPSWPSPSAPRCPARRSSSRCPGCGSSACPARDGASQLGRLLHPGRRLRRPAPASCGCGGG